MLKLVHRVALVALALPILAACGPASESSSADDATAATTRILLPPAALADLPEVELVAPGGLDAGRAPTFEWRPVAGAGAYRLTVLGPDAPRWAWTGAGTQVRYGGVAEGVNGPSLVAGSWWSVAALADDGAVIALSSLRSVSPGSDPGPAPTWTEVQAGAPADQSPGTADVGPPGARACDFLTGDEIAAAVRGTWGEPDESVYPSGLSGRCSWVSDNGSHFSLSILPASSYDPDGWGSDGDLDGLGDRAFVVNHGWDRRIGWIHGDLSLMLLIDYTRVDMEAFLGLAQLAESRLP